MKKLLIIILILSFMAAPVLAVSEDSLADAIHTWYVDTWIHDMEADREAWNKATVLAYIREMVNRGFVSKEDIQGEFGGATAAPKPTATPKATALPKSTPAPVKASDKYASLEIIPTYGYLLTKAGGHFYSIDDFYDDMEEEIIYAIEKDDKIVYIFDEDEISPRGLVQIDSTVYVAMVDAIYKYSDGKLTKITKDIPGYIHSMSTNGKDMYIACDDDSPWNDGAYFEGRYYKVSTSGTVTKLKGTTVPVDFIYRDLAVNKDGDRLAFVPFNDSGVKVRNLSTGSEYFQRDSEEDYYDNFGLYYNDYAVESILYYNNCLLANVKGSLVYYDEKNNVDNGKRAHTILGDMKGDRLYRESYVCQPGGSWPIKTGLGDAVRLGYVCTWTVGDDGYIYGITMERWGVYYTFKLALPDAVKKVNTYKKIK